MKREDMIALLEEQGSKPWDMIIIGGGANKNRPQAHGACGL